MKKTILFISTFFVLLAVNSQAVYKFDFGAGLVKKGYVKVLPGTKYSFSAGYGFEFSDQLFSGSYRGKDPLKDDYISSAKPFYFSVRLPEGNYNVKVVLGDRKGNSVTTIRAECRRLMVEKAVTKKGEFLNEEFTVHVKDSFIRNTNSRVRLKSREVNYLHWDDKLTLEFSNTAPKVCAVEIRPVSNIPVVFLAGNSTVVDQAEEPWASWGQMIPAFFKPGEVVIANYAESGETLKAFKGERRLDKIWSLAKPGDYLFIEFAHNDQKPGGNHLDPFTSYKATLKEWINEARKRRMNPVLVTSTSRRSFDSTGHIFNSLGDYPEAMRQTGREEQVPVIDLNEMSRVFYETLGPEKSVKAFVHYPANSFPNQPKELKDNTHFSTYGAYELAKCVVTGIRKEVPALAGYLRKNLPVYDPAHPSPFESWKLPVSTFTGAVKPDGN